MLPSLLEVFCRDIQDPALLLIGQCVLSPAYPSSISAISEILLSDQ